MLPSTAFACTSDPATFLGRQIIVCSNGAKYIGALQRVDLDEGVIVLRDAHQALNDFCGQLQLVPYGLLTLKGDSVDDLQLLPCPLPASHPPCTPQQAQRLPAPATPGTSAEGRHIDSTVLAESSHGSHEKLLNHAQALPHAGPTPGSASSGCTWGTPDSEPGSTQVHGNTGRHEVPNCLGAIAPMSSRGTPSGGGARAALAPSSTPPRFQTSSPAVVAISTPDGPTAENPSLPTMPALAARPTIVAPSTLAGPSSASTLGNSDTVDVACAAPAPTAATQSWSMAAALGSGAGSTQTQLMAAAASTPSPALASLTQLHASMQANAAAPQSLAGLPDSSFLGLQGLLTQMLRQHSTAPQQQAPGASILGPATTAAQSALLAALQQQHAPAGAAAPNVGVTAGGTRPPGVEADQQQRLQAILAAARLLTNQQQQAAALSSSLLQPSAALLAAQQYVAAAANTQAANAASAAAAAAAPGTLLGMLTPTHSNRGGTRAGVTHIATNAQSPYAAGRASASANLAPGGGVPGPVPGSTTPPVLPRTNATGGSALRHASPAPASSAHAAYGGSHAATLIALQHFMAERAALASAGFLSQEEWLAVVGEGLRRLRTLDLPLAQAVAALASWSDLGIITQSQYEAMRVQLLLGRGTGAHADHPENSAASEAGAAKPFGTTTSTSDGTLSACSLNARISSAANTGRSTPNPTAGTAGGSEFADENADQENHCVGGRGGGATPNTAGSGVRGIRGLSELGSSDAANPGFKAPKSGTANAIMLLGEDEGGRAARVLQQLNGTGNAGMLGTPVRVLPSMGHAQASPGLARAFDAFDMGDALAGAALSTSNLFGGDAAEADGVGAGNWGSARAMFGADADPCMHTPTNLGRSHGLGVDAGGAGAAWPGSGARQLSFEGFMGGGMQQSGGNRGQVTPRPQGRCEGAPGTNRSPRPQGMRGSGPANTASSQPVFRNVTTTSVPFLAADSGVGSPAGSGTSTPTAASASAAASAGGFSFAAPASFSAMGLCPSLSQGMADCGFKAPDALQAHLIAHLLHSAGGVGEGDEGSGAGPEAGAGSNLGAPSGLAGSGLPVTKVVSCQVPSCPSSMTALCAIALHAASGNVESASSTRGAAAFNASPVSPATAAAASAPAHYFLGALVLCPRREEAEDLGDMMRAVAFHTRMTCVTCVGGTQLAMPQQHNSSSVAHATPSPNASPLGGMGGAPTSAEATPEAGGHPSRAAPQLSVAVGTPGRVLDLLRRGTLDVGHIRMVVLAEAASLLSRHFRPQVSELAQHLGGAASGVQIVLLSPTEVLHSAITPLTKALAAAPPPAHTTTASALPRVFTPATPTTPAGFAGAAATPASTGAAVAQRSALAAQRAMVAAAAPGHSHGGDGGGAMGRDQGAAAQEQREEPSDTRDARDQDRALVDPAAASGAATTVANAVGGAPTTPPPASPFGSRLNPFARAFFTPREVSFSSSFGGAPGIAPHGTLPEAGAVAPLSTEATLSLGLGADSSVGAGSDLAPPADSANDEAGGEGRPVVCDGEDGSENETVDVGKDSTTALDPTSSLAAAAAATVSRSSDSAAQAGQMEGEAIGCQTRLAVTVVADEAGVRVLIAEAAATPVTAASHEAEPASAGATDAEVAGSKQCVWEE